MTVSPEVQARRMVIDVRGLPRPQGSMRAHTTPNGKVAMRYPPAVYEWRAQVQQAAVEGLNGSRFDGAVELRLGFDLPRPSSHYLPVNSKRSEKELRAIAPAYPTGMPDLDKLVRCVCDALTDAGIWTDDAQVVQIVAAKRFWSPPGVHIQVTEMA